MPYRHRSFAPMIGATEIPFFGIGSARHDFTISQFHTPRIFFPWTFAFSLACVLLTVAISVSTAIDPSRMQPLDDPVPPIVETSLDAAPEVEPRLEVLPMEYDESYDVTDLDEPFSIVWSAKSPFGAIGVGGGCSAGRGQILGGARGGRIRRQMSSSDLRRPHGESISSTVDELIIVARDDAMSSNAVASMGARDASDRNLGSCPLAKTDVHAHVVGDVAQVTVEQTYRNTFSAPIEAVYTFPLPSRAAITGFILDVDGRKVRGVVKSRAEAKAAYEEARARGHAASLLDQDGSAVFTQRVANIPPEKDVRVTITYFERVRFEDRRYAFVFPMTVIPRYGASRPDEVASSPMLSEPIGSVHGAAASSTPSVRSSATHTIDLAFDLQTPIPIAELTYLTHRMVEEKIDARHRVLRLSPDDRTPDRDLVIRWRLAGDETTAAMIVERRGDHAYFEALVQPEFAPSDAEIIPREITFILDTSGSMEGMPIRMAKAIVAYAVENLRPSDLFNVVAFAGESRRLFDRPESPSETTQKTVAAFLDGFTGSGGTEMADGLRRALTSAHDPNHLQMYVFLTDGFVNEESAILKAIADDTSGARFFAFGPGSAVNRGLLDAIGEKGHGRTLYADHREWDEAVRTVRAMLDLIEAPILVNATIDWNGLPVADVFPAQIPDLFAGGRIAILGRFTGEARGTAYLRGKIGTRTIEIPIAVDATNGIHENGAIATFWANARIDDLEDQLLRASDARVRGETIESIVRIATEFSLETPWTSFVAIDESAVTGDGVVRTVIQPHAIEGSRYITDLGIEVEMDSAGYLRVVRVDPGSAAEAGIKTNDTIVSIGGKKPDASLLERGFPTLTVGEKVVLGWEPYDGSRPRVLSLGR